MVIEPGQIWMPKDNPVYGRGIRIIEVRYLETGTMVRYRHLPTGLTSSTSAVILTRHYQLEETLD